MTVLRSGVSVFAAASKPTTEYGSQAKLQLKSGAAIAFVQFGLPSDLVKGATVLSATLRLGQVSAWTGSRTLSAQLNASKWSASKLNWTNRPLGVGTTVTQTLSGTPDSAIWSFDVTAHVQDIVDGARKNYGWRISTSDATARYIRGFAASSGKPTLEVTYTHAPAAPTSLHPSAGAVSIAKPYLRFDGGDDIAAIQVQVDPSANGTTPAFDSGVVSSTQGQLNLAATSYAGLADGASTQWRARVTDSAGQVSPWSQWATFSRVGKPVLTISNPTGVVWESTPPIVWSFAGQTAFQVLVATAAAPSKPLYDSGKIASTVGEHTPARPVFVADGENYVVTVRAWDSVVREATPGDPTYTETTAGTVLAYDPAVSPVSLLSAQQDTPRPWVLLRWQRAVLPDGWAVFRNDDLIFTADGIDLQVPGSSTMYEWQDWTAVPNREHVYRVAPVVNGITSADGPLETVLVDAPGIWIADLDNGADVVVWGDEAGSWDYGEDVTVYNPIGATAAVRVTTALRGLEGSLAGILTDTPVAPDHPLDDMEAAFWRIKANPAGSYRLAVGDQNIPVSLYDITLWPRQTSEGRLVNVSFGFSQTGELPFTVDL